MISNWKDINTALQQQGYTITLQDVTVNGAAAYHLYKNGQTHRTGGLWTKSTLYREFVAK